MLDRQSVCLIAVALGFAAVASQMVPPQRVCTVQIQRRGLTSEATIGVEDPRLRRLAAFNAPPTLSPRVALASFRRSNAEAYASMEETPVWQAFWASRRQSLSLASQRRLQHERFERGGVTVGPVHGRRGQDAWAAAAVAAVLTVVIGRHVCHRWPARTWNPLGAAAGLPIQDFAVEQPVGVWLRRGVGAAGVVGGPILLLV